MTCQDSFHEVAFNISFWTRNISSARILFWRGVLSIDKIIENKKLHVLNRMILLCITMCLRDLFRQL